MPFCCWLQLETWLPRNRAPKLKHLSSLTGLRQLCYKQTLVQAAIPGLEHLSALTALEVGLLPGGTLGKEVPAFFLRC